MQEGFFNIAPIKPEKGGRTCAACGRYKYVLNPKMEPFGNCKLDILNVGEAPGETEDRRGKQWQGKIGNALQYSFEKLGYDLFDDCVNINSMNCRPTDKKGNNREPSATEISCCRPRVLNVIETYKPKVILLFGQAAVDSIIGPKWMKDLGTISRWRGFRIPDREYNAWLCPLFHPSYPERGEKEIRTVWMQDLESALAMHLKPFPKWTDESKQVEIITDLSILEDIGDVFALDYETTGLKPHNTKLHHIACASVCDRKDHSYAFMFPEEGSRNMRYLRRLLKSRRKKIASNIKFEDTWTYVILNITLTDWYWDTMLAAHVLDNRPWITSIKFLSYIHFGIHDYDNEIAPYLHSDNKKNANSVNRIDELIKTETGRTKLLTYCGMDSLLEFKMAMKQIRELGANYGQGPSTQCD